MPDIIVTPPAPITVVVTPQTPNVVSAGPIDVAPTGRADQIESETFSYYGPLSAYTGKGRLYVDYPAQIVSVRFAVGDVSNQDLVLDVLKNGASIFTSQPRIVAGQNTAAVTTFGTYTVASGDFFTVNVVSSSLSQPAADLTVNIRFRRLS